MSDYLWFWKWPSGSDVWYGPFKTRELAVRDGIVETCGSAFDVIRIEREPAIERVEAVELS